MFKFSKIRPFGKRTLIKKVSEHFSAPYYLGQLSEFERSTVSDPLEHFLVYWNQNGYDPNPFFSMQKYLAANPDVAMSGLNPLLHFIEKGISEKRPLAPVGSVVQTFAEQDASNWEREENTISTQDHLLTDLSIYLFELDISFDVDPNRVDEDFYQSYFPDEEIGDCNAHFDEIGWRMELNPTPWFSTRFYLETYDDVNKAGINPFSHFINQGYKEFRRPNHPNYRNFTSVLKGKSIEFEATDWNSNYQFKLIDLISLKRTINNKKIKRGPLAISIGHSRYLSDVGGIQLYTYVEAKKFNELKINYLHISPSKVLPLLADASLTDLPINLTFNNDEIGGEFMLSDLADLISDIGSDVSTVAVIVNSLFGWHPELLRNAINSIAAENHYWVFHDYSTFCTNSNLNFEKLISCNNPKLDAGICATCRFGKNRTSHVERISNLLDSRDWKLITPSKSTTENVAKYLKIDTSHIETIPHGKLSTFKGLRRFAARPRVAFVGQPVIHKGWLNFLDFVDLGLKDFDFFHFGSVPSAERGINYFPLENRFDDLNAARDLLVQHQIDAVFICPTWEETFCFVAYEALAAGCKVICTKDSGNVFDASFGDSIIYDLEGLDLVSRIKEEILSSRKLDRHISDFEFTGTVASEFVS
jgi:glycosyltransferase involved in cell wall biosynthesis